MAIRLVTGGALNLNSTTYRIVEFDLGPVVRSEVFLEPFSARDPVLAATADRKTQMLIGLKVTSTTTTGLKTAIEAVRDELLAGTTLSYSWDSGVVAAVTLQLYPYQADPVDLQKPESYMVARSQFIVPHWVLRPWRQAWSVAGTKPPVI